MRDLPVTVFNGFLGAGKTTIILNLIKQLPSNYKSVWLKNEFGDRAIDTKLVEAGNIEVKEMVNGCLCCVLIGRLGEAVREITRDYQPERIIIESSGSAYPGPIALELRSLAPLVRLDGLVTVVDVVNFPGYIDKSYTARLQTQFTDLILINKHEQVDERRLDKALDDVYDLNPDTPKVKTNYGWVNAELVFGLDKNRRLDFSQAGGGDHHDEFEIREFDLVTDTDPKALEKTLRQFDKDAVYRAKGFVVVDKKNYLVNYVFGKVEIREVEVENQKSWLLLIGRQLNKAIRQLEPYANRSPD